MITFAGHTLYRFLELKLMHHLPPEKADFLGQFAAPWQDEIWGRCCMVRLRGRRLANLATKAPRLS